MCAILPAGPVEQTVEADILIQDVTATGRDTT